MLSSHKDVDAIVSVVLERNTPAPRTTASPSSARLIPCCAVAKDIWTVSPRTLQSWWEFASDVTCQATTLSLVGTHHTPSDGARTMDTRISVATMEREAPSTGRKKTPMPVPSHTDVMTGYLLTECNMPHLTEDDGCCQLLDPLALFAPSPPIHISRDVASLGPMVLLVMIVINGFVNWYGRSIYLKERGRQEKKRGQKRKRKIREKKNQALRFCQKQKKHATTKNREKQR